MTQVGAHLPKVLSHSVLYRRKSVPIHLVLLSAANIIKVYGDPSTNQNIVLLTQTEFTFKQKSVWAKGLRCYQIAVPSDSEPLPGDVVIANCFVWGSMHQVLGFELKQSRCRI